MAVATAPALAQRASADTPPADQTQVNGYLLDASGAPEAGGTLTLSLLSPAAEGAVVAVPLGEATTGDDGFFQFDVAPAELQQDSAGGIPIELNYSVAKQVGLIYDTRLVPSDDGSSDWTLQLPPTTVEEAVGAGDTPAPVFQVGEGAIDIATGISASVAQTLQGNILTTADGLVTTRKVAALRASSPKASGTTAESVPRVRPQAIVSGPGGSSDGTGDAGGDTGTDTEPLSVEPNGATSCSQVLEQNLPSEIVWEPTGVDDYRYVPTKLIITKDKATQGWDLARSNQTTMTIMENIGGDMFEGGFQAATTQASSADWDVTVTGANVNKLFSIKTEYAQQRAHCEYDSGAANPPDPSDYPALDEYKWTPTQVLTGNTLTDTSRTITCGGAGPAYTALYSVKTSIGTQSDVTYSGAFSINGVGLSSEQVDGTAQTFSVIPRSGKTAELCGNDGEPSVADLVREVVTS